MGVLLDALGGIMIHNNNDVSMVCWVLFYRFYVFWVEIVGRRLC